MTRKFLILILFICVRVFTQAQIDYYNRTNDLEESINAYEDILILNQDTSLVSGFLRDSVGKRFNTYTFINNINGDTIRSFKYGRDTLDIYGGLASNIFVSNDHIYSCGVYYETGKKYANLLKFTLDGSLIFDSLYYIDLNWTEFENILPTNDGNFFLVGSKETNIGNADSWLVKMDPNGSILWEKTFDYSSYDGAAMIVEHQNNFLISAGKSDLVTGELDLWLILVDSIGDIVWEKTYGGPFYDGGVAKPLFNGEIHLSGTREYASNKHESLVMRLDNEGDLIWEKTLFKMTTSFAPSSLSRFIELSDGSIIMEGVTYENDSPLDQPVVRLFKMSLSGDSLWTRYLKIRENDNYLTDLKLMDNGDFLMAGYVFPDSPENTEDGWIMRTNCLGYFEHPTDSVVLEENGFLLNAVNLSSFFEYTSINWGDNSSDTIYENANQNIQHQYTFPGLYIITSTTVACNDTIVNFHEYLVTPELFENHQLTIFPNPNNGEFQIWYNSDELYDLEILDLNGRRIKIDQNIQLKTGYTMNLSDLESSVYFVRATSGDQSFQTRIVLTH